LVRYTRRLGDEHLGNKVRRCLEGNLGHLAFGRVVHHDQPADRMVDAGDAGPEQVGMVEDGDSEDRDHHAVTQLE
jgi:hypothetical protein